MAGISTLDAVKIQARAVGPIVKALEARIGEQAAHELVRGAIAESWADHVAPRQAGNDHPRDDDNDFPVESVIVTDTDDEYRVNMVRCQFADYFRATGQPEIGALLTCGVDFAVNRRVHPDWEFTRTQTLMMGAEHCNFCWKRKAAESAP